MHRHDEITCTVIALLNHFWNLKLEDRAEDDTNHKQALRLLDKYFTKTTTSLSIFLGTSDAPEPLKYHNSRACE